MGNENHDSSAPSASFTDLISAYPILSALAPRITTLDLYNLALTSRYHFSCILASPTIFNALKRGCLCDGYGLAVQREARASQYAWKKSIARRHSQPEPERSPIDIRRDDHLAGAVCDAASGRPCTKCGVNFCGVCRGPPADLAHTYLLNGRPHLNPAYQSENVMCLCAGCDAATEAEVALTFPGNHELCDCDNRTRWVCSRCQKKENKFTTEYYNKHTEFEPDWPDDEEPPSKMLQDHQHHRAFWCICSAKVNNNTQARCTWCKRRHSLEDLGIVEFD